jgi:hypothetical protein
MAFWDSSAVVPPCCAQSGTAAGRRLLADLGRIIAWWGTPVEARSAFARLVRDGDLTVVQRATACRLLDQLRRSWDEILPTEAVRVIAESLPDDSMLSTNHPSRHCSNTPSSRLNPCSLASVNFMVGGYFVPPFRIAINRWREPSAASAAQASISSFRLRWPIRASAQSSASGTSPESASRSSTS